MLKDEFRPIDGKVLTIGRSPKEKIYMVPKAVFDYRKKKELRNSTKFSHHSNRKRIDFMGLYRLPPSQPVQEIEMIVEYFDKTVDSISVTSNLEELEKLVSSSFGTGASMNFPSATPPFSINPRWVKKITYRTK